MIIAIYGILTIAITASDILGLFNTVLHSPNDNMNNIDVDVLSNVVLFYQTASKDGKTIWKISTDHKVGFIFAIASRQRKH